jgi:hypothetical protein
MNLKRSSIMEIWKAYNEQYEVSSLGRVRSKGKMVRSTWGGEFFKEGRILKQNDNGQGYLQVLICHNGSSKGERVHRLVAMVFIENPEELPKVNHKDLNKYNNVVDNLEWCTQGANVAHAKANGRMIKGEAGITSKLTDENVREIKYLFTENHSNRVIADLFGVHPGTINCIRTGRNWSHIS